MSLAQEENVLGDGGGEGVESGNLGLGNSEEGVNLVNESGDRVSGDGVDIYEYSDKYKQYRAELGLEDEDIKAIGEAQGGVRSRVLGVLGKMATKGVSLGLGEENDYKVRYLIKEQKRQEKKSHKEVAREAMRNLKIRLGDKINEGAGGNIVHYLEQLSERGRGLMHSVLQNLVRVAAGIRNSHEFHGMAESFMQNFLPLIEDIKANDEDWERIIRMNIDFWAFSDVRGLSYHLIKLNTCFLMHDEEHTRKLLDKYDEYPATKTNPVFLLTEYLPRNIDPRVEDVEGMLDEFGGVVKMFEEENLSEDDRQKEMLVLLGQAQETLDFLSRRVDAEDKGNPPRNYQEFIDKDIVKIVINALKRAYKAGGRELVITLRDETLLIFNNNKSRELTEDKELLSVFLKRSIDVAEEEDDYYLAIILAEVYKNLYRRLNDKSLIETVDLAYEVALIPGATEVLSAFLFCPKYKRNEDLDTRIAELPETDSDSVLRIVEEFKKGTEGMGDYDQLHFGKSITQFITGADGDVDGFIHRMKRLIRIRRNEPKLFLFFKNGISGCPMGIYPNDEYFDVFYEEVKFQKENPFSKRHFDISSLLNMSAISCDGDTERLLVLKEIYQTRKIENIEEYQDKIDKVRKQGNAGIDTIEKFRLCAETICEMDEATAGNFINLVANSKDMELSYRVAELTEENPQKARVMMGLRKFFGGEMSDYLKIEKILNDKWKSISSAGRNIIAKSGFRLFDLIGKNFERLDFIVDYVTYLDGTAFGSTSIMTHIQSMRPKFIDNDGRFKAAIHYWSCTDIFDEVVFDKCLGIGEEKGIDALGEYLENLREKSKGMIGPEIPRELRKMEEYEYMVKCVFPGGNYSTYEKNLECGDQQGHLKKYKYDREGYATELTGLLGYNLDLEEEEKKEHEQLYADYQERFLGIKKFVSSRGPNNAQLQKAFDHKLDEMFERQAHEKFKPLEGDLSTKEKMLVMFISALMGDKEMKEQVSDMVIEYKYAYHENLEAYIQQSAGDVQRYDDEDSQRYLLWSQLGTIYGENLKHTVRHDLFEELTDSSENYERIIDIYGELFGVEQESKELTPGEKNEIDELFKENESVGGEGLEKVVLKIFKKNVPFRDKAEEEGFEKELLDEVSNWRSSGSKHGKENFVNQLVPKLFGMREKRRILKDKQKARLEETFIGTPGRAQNLEKAVLKFLMAREGKPEDKEAEKKANKMKKELKKKAKPIIQEWMKNPAWIVPENFERFSEEILPKLLELRGEPYEFSDGDKEFIEKIFKAPMLPVETRIKNIEKQLQQIFKSNISFGDEEMEADFDSQLAEVFEPWKNNPGRFEESNLDDFREEVVVKLGKLRKQYQFGVAQKLEELFLNDMNVINREMAKYTEKLDVEQKETMMGGKKDKTVEKSSKIRNIRSYFMKTQESANARMGAYLCIAGDEKMWENKDYFELVSVDEETGKCVGVVMLLNIEVDGKKYLWFGPNPFESFMTKVSSKDCYKYMYDTVCQFADENGYEGVVIPSNENSILGGCTNRGGDFPDLIKASRLRDKKGELIQVDFKKEHKLGGTYSYKDGVLVHINPEKKDDYPEVVGRELMAA